MTLKGILSRPSTSASSSNRFSTFDPSDSPRSTKSPERGSRGHSKVASLKRLSLSFAPSQAQHGRDSSFHNFLTQEPDEMSRQNSMAATNEQSASRSNTGTAANTGLGELQSNSVPMLKTTSQEEEHQDEDSTPKAQRLSLLKFRHASEPQLSTRYKEKEPVHEDPPPPPKIITTAPTQRHDEPSPRKSKDRFLPRTFSSIRKSMIIREESPAKESSLAPGQQDGCAASAPNLIRAMSENSPWKERHDIHGIQSPPAYGDESNSALALPLNRLSESGGSEGSSGSHKLYAHTTTTHFIETTTTIFKLKRNRKKKTKDKGPLFPLPEKLPPPSSRTSISQTDAGSAYGRSSISPSRKSTQGVRWKNDLSRRDTPVESPSASVTALTNAPLGSPGPAIARKHSTLSANSGATTPTGTLVPPRLGARGRSSTMGSLGRSNERLADPPPSGRNSTSTTGRRSFGDILTQRLRKDSGPPKHSSDRSGSTPGSKANSFQIAREAEPELVYPRREEEDTPASYLEKLEAAVPRGAMATILCKSADDFSKTCLRKYMRGFSYFGESIDISIRKMLMEVVLPKETQQIDRLLMSFADRYHECNPGIFMNADEANFVAFSILLLQSDNHNKNNKRKMTKQDYVKNTQNGKISVAEDILDCFYDNICYTPFIHFDDEIAVNNHRLGAPKRKGLIRSKSSEMLRGPIDPYALILDHKLETLRPSLKDVIETEDSYGTAPINSEENHKAFVHAAVLQIVSARSRPDAFTTQATISNPAEAQVGLVSIKVAKVGLLWRKSTKKKKAKSPWQEWGVILTDSKLYFFKDVGWVKKLINQYEGQAKVAVRSAPLVFKPPLTSFEPDAWMSVDDAVALTDSTYRRHKNAFTFIKHGGFEEVFLANSENDVADWISKLNYAATFTTARVRMRGLFGTNYDARNMYRKESEISTTTTGSRENDQPLPNTGKTNPQLTWEIMFYRRQLVSEQISNFDDHVAAAQKELEYLLRNARHLLILLPIQQKTREAIVFAAGRMSAKLKWTRKEIWRAKTHRDVLIKDLEAEATSSFPASTPPVATRNSTTATPLKATPTKAGQSGLMRTDTDQTVRSNLTKSPLAATPASAGGARRASQTILEHIRTDTTEPPELSQTRRQSASSHVPKSPTYSPRVGNDQASVSRARTPSLHTQASQNLSMAGESQAATDFDNEENLLREAGMLGVDSTTVTDKDDRRGSESGKESALKHNLSHLQHDGSFKERAGSVRRSLQKTLRDSSGHSHMHMPHHSRSKKGKESGSSLAVTEDGRSIMSGESEELKRDPTGRFVLHGKKASVITMGPEWQLSSEDRVKLREQMLKEQVLNEDSEPTTSKRASLHIDTGIIDAKRRSVDTRSTGTEDLSPTAKPAGENEDDVDGSNRKSMADSNRMSLYSAVTTPAGVNDTFHSAESSPRPSTDDEEEDKEEEESTFIADGLLPGLKPVASLANLRSEVKGKKPAFYDGVTGSEKPA
ncbi:hypothetical protein OHC33_009101 [Knufia fluminis]|uniref:Uncharacterized protein n=1 Tax=Knufia fluminis TaxID=191047 RepID=A0AAN8F254_9EURO|nr:hypothetical protein OHC33_009101 [Knufia fluminis]